MVRRKIKIEITIEANKKTCGNFCKHRALDYCYLFNMRLTPTATNYKRLEKCILAENGGGHG